MKKLIFIFIIVFLAFFLFFKYFVFNRNSKEVEFTVTSNQIYEEYKENEVAANNKYKGKLIKVIGVLIGFNETLGTNYCNIGSEIDVFGEVNCVMSDDFVKHASEYKIGQSITLQGICKGIDLLGRIRLE